MTLQNILLASILLLLVLHLYTSFREKKRELTIAHILKNNKANLEASHSLAGPISSELIAARIEDWAKGMESYGRVIKEMRRTAEELRMAEESRKEKR